jgi:hypothetical protein
MARYFSKESYAELPWAPKVNAAADFWRKHCFFGDRSLFWQGDLWTLENLSELYPRIEKFEFGKGKNYFTKLRTQLNGASRDAVRLDAELHWLLYLILLGKTIKWYRATLLPGTKRRNLQKILDNNREELPNTRWLNDKFLMGLAANKYFLPTFYEPHLSLIKTLIAWKKLAPAARDSFATAPWRFAEWCDKQPKSMHPGLRNTLLYLLFPDSFEDIMVQDDKDVIVKRHCNTMTDQSWMDFESGGGFKNKVQVDQAILEIRAKLTAELGRRLHFYQDVLNEGAILPGSDPNKWPIQV